MIRRIRSKLILILLFLLDLSHVSAIFAQNSKQTTGSLIQLPNANQMGSVSSKCCSILIVDRQIGSKNKNKRHSVARFAFWQWVRFWCKIWMKFAISVAYKLLKRGRHLKQLSLFFYTKLSLHSLLQFLPSFLLRARFPNFHFSQNWPKLIIHSYFASCGPIDI